MDAVADHVVAELIGLAVDRAGLDAAAGHPGRETAGMMIPSEVGLDFALAIVRAAELTSPDDERVIAAGIIGRRYLDAKDVSGRNGHARL